MVPEGVQLFPGRGGGLGANLIDLHMLFVSELGGTAQSFSQIILYIGELLGKKSSITPFAASSTCMREIIYFP